MRGTCFLWNAIKVDACYPRWPSMHLFHHCYYSKVLLMTHPYISIIPNAVELMTHLEILSCLDDSSSEGDIHVAVTSKRFLLHKGSLGHGFLILCLSKPPPEPMHCRPKNKKQTSIFIYLPTADSILCYSATNSPTEMADHFSWSARSIDNKTVTPKFLAQFNLMPYCKQRNTIL